VNMVRNTVPLGDLVTFFRGGTSFRSSEYGDSGIPVLTKGDVKPFGRIKHSGRFVNVAHATEAGYYLTQPGDLLVTTRDLTIAADFLGIVAPVPNDRPYLVNQGANILRLDASQIDIRYFVYWTCARSYREHIKATHSGSTQIHIRNEDLFNAPVYLPPLNEQRRIAQILGAIDDKIDLNWRMNETLEAITSAVFRSWFIDHESSGMKGTWPAKSWGDLVTLEYGKSLQNYDENDAPYAVFGTNGIIGRTAQPLCLHEGIIIGRKGAYRGVHFSDSPFFAIDTAFYVKPKVPLEMRWAYYEMLRLDINGMDSGSAIPSTSREDFYALPVLEPPIDLQRTFVNRLSPAWERQRANEAENGTLTSLRDTLLPKLLSGEIRVGSAEREVAEVV